MAEHSLGQVTAVSSSCFLLVCAVTCLATKRPQIACQALVLLTLFPAPMVWTEFCILRLVQEFVCCCGATRIMVPIFTWAFRSSSFPDRILHTGFWALCLFHVIVAYKLCWGDHSRLVPNLLFGDRAFVELSSWRRLHLSYFFTLVLSDCALAGAFLQRYLQVHRVHPPLPSERDATLLSCFFHALYIVFAHLFLSAIVPRALWFVLLSFTALIVSAFNLHPPTTLSG